MGMYVAQIFFWEEFQMSKESTGKDLGGGGGISIPCVTYSNN